MLCLVTQLHPTLCGAINCSLPGWNFPGKNTGVGCHFLLQKIFLTQESKHIGRLILDL